MMHQQAQKKFLQKSKKQECSEKQQIQSTGKKL